MPRFATVGSHEFIAPLELGDVLLVALDCRARVSDDIRQQTDCLVDILENFAVESDLGRVEVLSVASLVSLLQVLLRHDHIHRLSGLLQHI